MMLKPFYLITDMHGLCLIYVRVVAWKMRWSVILIYMSRLGKDFESPCKIIKKSVYFWLQGPLMKWVLLKYNWTEPLIDIIVQHITRFLVHHHYICFLYGFFKGRGEKIIKPSTTRFRPLKKIRGPTGPEKVKI